MLAADQKILQRLAPHLKRVLIVDANMAAARLLADLLKGMGAKHVYFEPDERSALEMAREIDPQLILIEHSGPRLNGESLARKIRRSNYACRKAPIIMVSSDTAAMTIRGARDSGVHEFLRKPFNAGDLFKRVAVVSLKPRDWVEAVGYVGPDRRRFNSGDYRGQLKREADKPEFKADADKKIRDQAFRILRAAYAQFDRDPNQALRAIAAQTTTLKRLAVEGSEARLAVALTGLEVALGAASPTREFLTQSIMAVLAFADLEARAEAPPQARAAS